MVGSESTVMLTDACTLQQISDKSESYQYLPFHIKGMTSSYLWHGSQNGPLISEDMHHDQ